MKHLLLASDGDLVNPDNAYATVRAKYRYTFQRIDNTLELRATLRAGSRTSIGGYPLYLMTHDGNALHFDCARREYRQVSWSIRNHCSDGWQIGYCDINYENTDLYCEHCGKQIESAYGEEAQS
jgi:hypothetical protein